MAGSVLSVDRMAVGRHLRTSSPRKIAHHCAAARLCALAALKRYALQKAAVASLKQRNHMHDAEASASRTPRAVGDAHTHLFVRICHRRWHRQAQTVPRCWRCRERAKSSRAYRMALATIFAAASAACLSAPAAQKSPVAPATLASAPYRHLRIRHFAAACQHRAITRAARARAAHHKLLPGGGIALATQVFGKHRQRTPFASVVGMNMGALRAHQHKWHDVAGSMLRST